MEYRIMPAGNKTAKQQLDSLIQQNTTLGWQFLRTESVTGNEYRGNDINTKMSRLSQRQVLVFKK